MYLKLSVLSSSDNNVDTLAIFEVVKAPLRQRSAIRLSKGLHLPFVKPESTYSYSNTNTVYLRIERSSCIHVCSIFAMDDYLKR